MYLTLHFKIIEAARWSKCTKAKRISHGSITHVDEVGFIGIPKAVITPVFELALQLRSLEPVADSILTQTKKQFDYALVVALVDAALRLEPPRNSLKGIREQIEQSAQNSIWLPSSLD